MSDINDRTHDVSITSEDQAKKVSVITDGAVQRLAVNANVEGGITLQRFSTKVQYSTANTALNTVSDTTLFTLTADGQIDFVAIAGSNSTYQVVFVVDSIEVLRITMNALGSDIGLSNVVNIPIAVETANKNFRFTPITPVDFVTSFVVKAKAISGTPTVNWLALYREIT